MPSANCPAVVATGRCSSTDCTFNHTILTCEPCGFLAADANAYASHVQSRNHRSILAGSGHLLRCPICALNMTTGVWEQHVKGKKHKKKASLLGASSAVNPSQPISTLAFTFCEICNAQIQKGHWERHGTSARHRRREVYMQYRAVLNEVEKDRNGLIIEGGKDINYVAPASSARRVSFDIQVKSIEPSEKLRLVDAKLLSQQRANGVPSGFSVTTTDLNAFIKGGRPAKINLTFEGIFIGRYEDRLELTFEDVQSKKKFMIARPIIVIVGDKGQHEALGPKGPYTPRPKAPREAIKKVVEGVPPRARTSIPYVKPLPKAGIPPQLLKILDGTDTIQKQIEDVKRTQSLQEFSKATYPRTFKTLLWVEEHKAEAELERYDMHGTTLDKRKQYYFLGVPGLAEKRPSVLIGDRILVQKVNAPKGHWFEGHVHVVTRDEAGLCFHTSFGGWTKTQKYNIQFKLNRIVYKRQHQALDSAFKEDRVLFPEEEHVLPSHPTSRIKYINSLIPGNVPQTRAIRTIINLPPGSPPFVVFGPPGTGKTITIVEAIGQLLRKNPNAKVLACAPSNSAADLIAERLCTTLRPDALFRMYAPSRSKTQMPEALRNYVHFDEQGDFSVPPMAKMKEYRVIVATCIAASMAHGIGMPGGHFSHIFIDEAGQATEPEAMVSIKTMSNQSTNIVLSGDPKQLGPVIRSPIAINLGLETSYLQRLMNSWTYQVNTNSTTIVKLVKNFRSHPAILRFPNEQFYSGDLQPCAPASKVDAFINWPALPNPKFPIIFHAVSGTDARELSSPSFFNVDEILQVQAYIQRLKEDQDFKTNDNEIGVITPYHAQCLKIRSAIRSVPDGVKVGSVEEFQGQERKVVIISTVRSSSDFIDYDLRHTLGFVANPRRFNVAVTRAQALLIIVGNPHVLGLDPLWRSFLNYIWANSGWTGSMNIPWNPDDDDDDDDDNNKNSNRKYDARVRKQAEVDMNDFTRRMEELALANAEDVNDGDDADVNHSWRDVE